jgi:hypothetical protein
MIINGELMNGKILLVAFFSLILFVSIAGSISFVKADIAAEPKVSYDTWGDDSVLSLRLRSSGLSKENLTMTILSPGNDEVLNNNTAVVKVNIGTQMWPINSVYYEADWQKGKHCIYNINNGTSDFKMFYRLAVTANFTEIPDGKHHITIYANIHDGSHGSSSIDFTINAPPSIAILTLEDKTYQTADLPLNFTVNEPVKWVGYSLDGKKNITITGNSTMTNLSNGSHSITVYANDSSGNMGTSKTTSFFVDAPLAIIQAAIIVVCSIAVAVGISVGLLIYRKKHKCG